MEVALVHDYLTQRGGAERVVLSMQKAFPDAPLYTSLYDPETTLPGFRGTDVRTLSINRVGALRRNHRLALPLLAPAFSRLRVRADVTVCSTSGWSHGLRTEGRKLVYCHAPARWLYQAERYLGTGRGCAKAVLSALTPLLRGWDRRAAGTADRYVTNSTMMRESIRAVYGIDADLLPPPHSIDPAGPRRPVDGVEPGFHLCVSRLLPYKNVDAIVEAVNGMRQHRLVVVGSGPEVGRLTALAGPNVRVLGSVTDEQLRWLYAESLGLVAASYEDYGLTPLEAASFGKPVAALRWGGFLDTVVEGDTGVFFDRPEPSAVREALRRLSRERWDEVSIRAHAERYSEGGFTARLQAVVREVAA
jgi:glycosyltransferase involved in cell wall biosynthesis